MSQRSKFIYIALSAICCLSLLTNCSRAISQQDVKRIEAAMPAKAAAIPKRPRKLLVFNLCKGFKHGSIPYWDKTLEIMGRKTGAFQAVVSNDMAMFEPDKLNQFDAVCFNNTTRLKFDANLRRSLMAFIKGGKGIVGIHAATDNFYDWPEAAEMMGGQFCGHPWGGGGTWAVKIDDPEHPLMAAYKGKGFKVKDEIYRTKPPLYTRAKQRVLMSLDMADEATGKKASPSDTDIGISWVKSYGKGRLFYCSLGHNNHLTWDPALLEHYLAGIQFALGDFPVDTKPKLLKSVQERGSEMDGLLEKIKKYDYGQSRATLTELSDKIRDAYGSRAELGRIEKSLLGVLRSDATPAAKQFVCRKLSIIGSEASVGVLTAMLTQKPASKQEPHPADMARYALERIPGAAVDGALRKALAKTTGKTKVGIINSLGQRRDSKAVGALGRLVYNSDALIADAAAAALGHIAGSDATKALAEAKNKTKGKLRLVVLDSYLKCADRLAAEGKRREASAIYRQLATEPAPIGAAALRGMVTVRGRRRR